ncbi:MAG: VOC family protein [Minicystis sp.]
MTTGIEQLGYLGFEVSDLGAWESFATEVLGLIVADRRADGGFSLRMDGHAHRLLISPGSADDLAVLGWQVEGPASLETITARLRTAGVEVIAGTPEEAALRKVEGLVKFTDPGGLPSEVFYGPALASKPFQSPLVRSGFVADALGLGHLVVSAKSQEENRRFYCEVLGFRVSDSIRCDLHGYKVDILFLHTNARHHSLAFGDRQKKRLHHFMLEVRGMDDVGLGFDRALKAGVRIMQTLGRHPNDRMFSFYAKTPSGFQFELGWGGREIDDSTWQPTTYDHVSAWGHQPPAFLSPAKDPPGGSR